MKNDNRSLHRIDNTFGVDLTAVIKCGGKLISCTVLDYNSIGIAVRCEDSSVVTENIDFIQLNYGVEVVCFFENPKLIRNEAKKTIISLKEKSTQGNKLRRTRVVVSEMQQGMVMGLDPTRLNQTLYFRVVDVSETGMRIQSSKSNRHLTPGLELKNFDLVIPGLGSHKVHLKITNSTITDKHIMFGAELKHISSDLKTDLKRYILMNLPSKQKSTYSADGIKGLKVKEFSSTLRITRVSNEQEYHEMLLLRFIAYQAANKTKDGTTWEDMQDRYDKNSIIYTAHFGQHLVGTMRLSFSNEDSSLPCEDYLNLKELLPHDRSKISEISRLAVDPDFQGGDLFIALLRHMIVELGAKQVIHPICLATKTLSPYYESIGAKRISASFPHPVTKGETLALYLFDHDTSIDAKMSSLGWFKVIKPSLTHLHRLKFIRKPSKGYFKYLFLPFEFMQFTFRKKIAQRSKQRLKMSSAKNTNKHADNS